LNGYSTEVLEIYFSTEWMNLLKLKCKTHFTVPNFIDGSKTSSKQRLLNFITELQSAHVFVSTCQEASCDAYTFEPSKRP